LRAERGGFDWSSMKKTAGFVNPACSAAYFEVPEVVEQVMHFTTGLSDDEREQLRTALREAVQKT